MTRTAILVPTPHGPLEAIVHEPDGSPVACAVALPGATSRAETNRKWARVADSLAGLGIVVLRFNYLDEQKELRLDDAAGLAHACEGIDWFRDRMAPLGLLLCGHCQGTRVCLMYAAANPTLGVGLVAPLLPESFGRRDRASIHAMQLLARLASRARVRLPARSKALDPDMARDLVAVGSNPRPWILIGDRDYQWRGLMDPRSLPRELASTDVEVVPGVQLHNSRTLDSQDVMVERVTAWAARTLAASVAS